MTTSSSTPGARLLLLTALQVLVALVFLKGFLLTRVELPDVAGCQQGSTCGSSGGHQLPGRYSKAVVLIVDAVRYDFLCGKQGADADGQLSGSLMPKTLRLVQQAGVRVGQLHMSAAVHPLVGYLPMPGCACQHSCHLPGCAMSHHHCPTSLFCRLALQLRRALWQTPPPSR